VVGMVDCACSGPVGRSDWLHCSTQKLLRLAHWLHLVQVLELYRKSSSPNILDTER
jgi:hypothetical protein